MLQAVQGQLVDCVEANTAALDEDVANSFFDEDARLDAAVFIDPTVEVNGDQVRSQCSPSALPVLYQCSPSARHCQKDAVFSLCVRLCATSALPVLGTIRKMLVLMGVSFLSTYNNAGGLVSRARAPGVSLHSVGSGNVQSKL